MRYFLDLKQLESLGWKETIKFDEGLKQTVDWFCALAFGTQLLCRMSSCLKSSYLDLHIDICNRFIWNRLYNIKVIRCKSCLGCLRKP